MLLLSGEAHSRRIEQGFLSKYAALLDIALRASDLAIVVLTAMLANRLRFGAWALQPGYVNVVVPMVLLTALFFPVFRLYTSWRGARISHEALRLVLAWSFVAGAMLVIDWAVKHTAITSRLWAGSWFVLALVLFVASRALVRLLLGWLRSRGVDLRKVVLIGATEAGAKMIEAVRARSHMGLDVIGYVSTPFDDRAYDGVPCLDSLDDYLPKIAEQTPDQLWIALPLRAEVCIQQVMEATATLAIQVRLLPDFFGYVLINHHAGSVAGVPVITLRGSRVEGHARIAKAFEDRVLALAFLLLLSPLMLLIAVAVKCTSRGPVMFRQKRHGLAGREIVVWKFRTMRVHSEGAGQVTQATRHDARTTKLGRLLRRTSLDELPQLFNVLAGHMSLVGPRPHAIEHNQHFSEVLVGYMQRHGVKPGMTGLAQVNGLRGETDTLEKISARVDADIRYIHHWSIWLDFKILALTPFALLKQTNAY